MKGPTAVRLGFKFEHTLAGSYYLLADPADEKPVRVTLTARAPRLHRFVLNKNLWVSGTVHMEGIAGGAAVEGQIHAHLDHNRIRYDLGFVDDGGRPYELQGEMDIQPIDLLDTLTTLPASLYDGGGREVGRAALRFDWRHQLVPFLRSFRMEGAVFES